MDRVEEISTSATSQKPSTQITDENDNKELNSNGDKDPETLCNTSHSIEPDKQVDTLGEKWVDTLGDKQPNATGIESAPPSKTKVELTDNTEHGIDRVGITPTDVDNEIEDGQVAMATNVETDADDIAALLEGPPSPSGNGPIRTRRRYWKKRVADYVSSLPSFDKFDELGILPPEGDVPISQDVTDWKRQKLDEEKKPKIEPTTPKKEDSSVDRINQRHQRLMAKPSLESIGSSQVTSSLVSSSSDSNAIHQWLDSMNAADIGKHSHHSSSPTAAIATSSEQTKVKLTRSVSSEDDLSLGAEATLMQPLTLGVPTSPNPNTALRNHEFTNEEILAYAGRQPHSPSRPVEDRRAWLTRMAEKHTSMTSELSEMTTTTTISSVDELLQARNDPEQLLRSLGFGSVTEVDCTSRIPDRFLSKPSQAKGIDLERFLAHAHEREENRAASVGGYLGIQGAGVFKSGGAAVVNKVATMNSIVNLMKKNVAQSANAKSSNLSSLFGKPGTQTDGKSKATKSAEIDEEMKQSKKPENKTFSPSKKASFMSLVSIATKNDESTENTQHSETPKSSKQVSMETGPRRNLLQEVIEEEGITESDSMMDKGKCCHGNELSPFDKSGVEEIGSVMNHTDNKDNEYNVDSDEDEKGHLERTLTSESFKEELHDDVTMETKPNISCTLDSRITDVITMDAEDSVSLGNTVSEAAGTVTDSVAMDTLSDSACHSSDVDLGSKSLVTMEIENTDFGVLEAMQMPCDEMCAMPMDMPPSKIDDSRVLVDEVVVAEKCSPVLAANTVAGNSPESQRIEDLYVEVDHRTTAGQDQTEKLENEVEMTTELSTKTVYEIAGLPEKRTRHREISRSYSVDNDDLDGISEQKVHMVDDTSSENVDLTTAGSELERLTHVLEPSIARVSRDSLQRESLDSKFDSIYSAIKVLDEGMSMEKAKSYSEHGAFVTDNKGEDCYDSREKTERETCVCPAASEHIPYNEADTMHRGIQKKLDENSDVTSVYARGDIFKDSHISDAKELLEKIQKHVQEVSDKFEVEKANVTQYAKVATCTSPLKSMPRQIAKLDRIPWQPAEDVAKQLKMEKIQEEDSIGFREESGVCELSLPGQPMEEETTIPWQQKVSKKASQVPQESFEIEEISSIDHDGEEVAPNSAYSISPEHRRQAMLLRTSSAQSDSSGFADDTHIDPSLIHVTDSSTPYLKVHEVSCGKKEEETEKPHDGRLGTKLFQHKKSSTESSCSDVTVATEFENKLSSASSLDVQDETKEKTMAMANTSDHEQSYRNDINMQSDDLSTSLTSAEVRVSLTEPHPVETVETILDSLQRTIEDVTGSDHKAVKRKQSRQVRTERFVHRSQVGRGDAGYSDVLSEGIPEEPTLYSKDIRPRSPLRRSMSVTMVTENGQTKTEKRRRGKLKKAHSMDEDRDRENDTFSPWQTVGEDEKQTGAILKDTLSVPATELVTETKADIPLGDERHICEGYDEVEERNTEQINTTESGSQTAEDVEMTTIGFSQTKETQTELIEEKNSTFLTSPVRSKTDDIKFDKLDISPILRTSTSSDGGRAISDSSLIRGKQLNIGTETVVRQCPPWSDPVLGKLSVSSLPEEGSFTDTEVRSNSFTQGERSAKGHRRRKLKRAPSWAEEANIETHPIVNVSPHDVFFNESSSKSDVFLKMLPRGSSFEDEMVPSQDDELRRVSRTKEEKDELVLKSLLQQPIPYYGNQVPPLLQDEAKSADISNTESAMKEVKCLQQGIQKYKSDLVALEILSTQQYQEVYDQLTVDERNEWDELKLLRKQIMEEVYEMEELLSARTRTMLETKQKKPLFDDDDDYDDDDDDDDCSVPEYVFQSLDMIKQMIELLKEQTHHHALLRQNIQLHSTLTSYHSGLSSPVSEHSVDSSWVMERDSVLQQLLVIKRDLEDQRMSEKKEREKSMEEMKTTIIEEITYNITKETENLKVELKNKDMELKQLRRQLQEHKRKHQREQSLAAELEQAQCGEIT